MRSEQSTISGPVDAVVNVPTALTFGSLFAGIGGFDLGFERAGMVCKWQVEIDEYAQRVLAKHWPNVRRWDDVRTWPQPDTERVDVICGGFPCQDISSAGKKAGIGGERSGLFFDLMRVVCEMGPRFVVLENVSALLHRGMDAVLGELAERGFDAEWFVLPAAAVGARQLRERVFVIAVAAQMDDSHCVESRPVQDEADGHFRRWLSIDRGRSFIDGGPWAREPGMARVADGVPNRLDRCRGLGNAVVPQVAEWIGRRIVAAAQSVV